MQLILLVALLLRLPLLGQSLWLDEAIQAQALMGKLGPIMQYALADFQPPLYHFLLLAWTKIAGFSEIALRTPSLLAGVATVYFVTKIGELLGGKKLALLAGLLTATNPLLIYYSQEGRTYALTTFLVTASMYYYLKINQNKSTNLLSTIYYLLFTTFFIWTSYLSWFVLFGQALLALVHKRRDLFRLSVVSALTILPWLPSFFNSLSFGLGDASSLPAWAKVVGGASGKALALTWIKLNLGRFSFENNYLYLSVIIILFALHFLALKKLSLHKAETKYLLTWITAPIALGLLISIFVPAYSYTRVLFIVPAYLLLLAMGLHKLGSRALTAILVTAQLCFLFIFWLTPEHHREDWRALTADLNPQANIMVALPSLKTSAPLNYYSLESAPVELGSADLSSQAPVYYIRYGEDIFDPGRLGQANLEDSGYTIISEKVYSGIQLDIYENRH